MIDRIRAERSEKLIQQNSALVGYLSEFSILAVLPAIWETVYI